MEPISVEQLNELLRDTIENSGSGVLRHSDEDIACLLFEDCDVGMHSFLHESSLKRLREAEVIDDEDVATATMIRRQWFDLTAKQRNMDQIRNGSEWRRLFDLCDQFTNKSKGNTNPR